MTFSSAFTALASLAGAGIGVLERACSGGIALTSTIGCAFLANSLDKIYAVKRADRSPRTAAPYWRAMAVQASCLRRPRGFHCSIDLADLTTVCATAVINPIADGLMMP